MRTITERVDAGEAFMDANDPGWWRADVERAIDLNKLALQYYDSCILGQRCPLETLAAYVGTTVGHLREDDHLQAYHAYASELTDYGWSKEWACNLGFNAEDDGDFPLLTAEWKCRIAERRSAA